jgi:poly-gamma-glutamate system protein
MKKIYWRPPNVSRTALALVTVVAMVAHVAVEWMPVRRKQRYYREKITAARLSRDAMNAIKAERLSRGHKIDPEVDPASTGMIGKSVTAVTSNTGYLTAKLTSTNPNFAAAIVDMLERAGIARGEVVAVGVSGSFPALNVSTYAAIQVLGLVPVIIASTSSSEWGANLNDYLWLDMETTIRAQGMVSFSSNAASYGGIDDLGIGITKNGRALLDAARTRNKVSDLSPTSLADAIDKRMALYEELAGDRPMKAYINVGGGSASVGTHIGKKQFKPGLNRSLPMGVGMADSVMLRFSKRDVPVIHLSRVKLLAQRYRMPYAPKQLVPIGQGEMFVKTEYNRWLALIGLIAIFTAMFVFLRWNIGSRMLTTGRAREGAKPLEPMV